MRLLKFFNKKRRGALSIFMVIIYSTVFTIEALLVDGTRMRIAGSEVEEAQQMATESALAAFNEPLYQYYDLLGESQYTTDELKSKIQQMMELQLGTDTNEDNFYRNYMSINALYLLTDKKSFDPFHFKVDNLTVGSNCNLSESKILKSQIADSMRYKGVVYLADSFLDMLSRMGELTSISDTVENCSNAIKDVYEPYGDLYKMAVHLQKNIDGFLEEPDMVLTKDSGDSIDNATDDTYTDESGNSPTVNVKDLPAVAKDIRDGIKEKQMQYESSLNENNEIINDFRMDEHNAEITDDDVEDHSDDIEEKRKDKDYAEGSLVQNVIEEVDNFSNDLDTIKNNIDTILSEIDKMDQKISKVEENVDSANGTINKYKGNDSTDAQKIANGFSDNVEDVSYNVNKLKEILSFYKDEFTLLEENKPDAADVKIWITDEFIEPFTDKAAKVLEESKEQKYEGYNIESLTDDEYESFYDDHKNDPTRPKLLDAVPENSGGDSDDDEDEDEDEDETTDYYVFYHIPNYDIYSDFYREDGDVYQHVHFLKQEMDKINDNSRLPDAFYYERPTAKNSNHEMTSEEAKKAREQNEIKSTNDAKTLKDKESNNSFDPKNPDSNKVDIQSKKGDTSKIDPDSLEKPDQASLTSATDNHKLGTIKQRDAGKSSAGTNKNLGNTDSKSATKTKEQNQKTLKLLNDVASQAITDGYKGLLECTYIMSNCRDYVHMNNLTAEKLSSESDVEYDSCLNKKFLDDMDMSGSYYLTGSDFKNIEVSCAEQEYILFGLPDTKDDLTAAYTSIFLIRLALDYISVWCTEETRQAVLDTAEALSFTGVGAVIALAAMPLVFSVPRAGADMALIMTAKKAPLIYTSIDDWAYHGEKNDDLTLCGYTNYMMLLLLINFGDAHTNRLMDVIQTNMQNLKGYSDFKLEDALAEVHVSSETSTDYLFSTMGLVPEEYRQKGRIKFKVNTAFSY